jgi:hypothetical protein
VQFGSEGGADAVQLIDIIETVYRGAAKGRGLVVSPKGASRALRLPSGRALKGRRLLDALSLLSSATSALVWVVLVAYLYACWVSLPCNLSRA